MKAIPLPPHRMAKGRGRAATIRTLYAERCNVAEIALHLGVSVAEVRRTLHRPA